MSFEVSAIAPVPLEIPKGNQSPLFGLKYVPVGRVRCIQKSEALSSFTGFSSSMA
jgi:hypothetical protein